MEGNDDERVRPIVERARHGDADAWEELFRRLYPRLRAYAARRVSIDAVDDVVSETMTRAIASMHTYDETRNGFDAWVFGIARRAAADHERKLRRFRRTDGHRADVPTAPLGEALDIADDHAKIAAAFEQLAPRDQELLELRVIAGLSAEEVATVLGKKPGAVRVAQHRALARLREILGEAT